MFFLSVMNDDAQSFPDVCVKIVFSNEFFILEFPTYS